MIPLLVVAFFGLVLLALPLKARLFRALRLRHAQLHQRLGSPAVFRPATDQYATPRMWRFFVLREHRALRDPDVSRLADALRAVVSLAAVILLFVFVWRALA